MSIKLLSSYSPNTMHKYLHSQATFLHVSVEATTTVVREDNSTAQKENYF